MCVGHTLGEEVILGFEAHNGVRRTESVSSTDSSCVILNYVLQSHFIQKNKWRAQANVDPENEY